MTIDGITQGIGSIECKINYSCFAENTGGSQIFADTNRWKLDRTISVNTDILLY